MTESPITAAASGRYRAPGTTAQALGLLLMGLVGLTFLLAGTLIGGTTGENVVPIAALTVGGLVGAVLAARFGTWSKVLGIVLALVLAAPSPIGTFWAIFGAFMPAQSTEFAPALMYLFGFFLALIGGIVALVKRNAATAGPGRRERRLRSVLVTIVVIAAVASVVLSILGRQTVAADDETGATEVRMADFEFHPEDIVVPAGEVTFLLRNEDGFFHNFSNEDLDLNENVLGPGEVTVTVDVPAGTYEIVCVPHEQQGMTATLTAE